MNYKTVDRSLIITRGDVGASGSPFYSSFHNMDADVDQIGWIMSDTLIVLRNAFGAGEKRAYFDSENLFSFELYTAIQGIAPVNPLVMIKRYCERNGIRLFTSGHYAYDIIVSFTYI